MRVVRTKVGKKVETLLREVTKELGIEDYGYTCDVFALLRKKGSGLPSPERLDAIIDACCKQDKTISKISLRILVKKRVQVLKALTNTSYFKSLACSVTSYIDGTRQLLVNLRKMYLKTREAQCISCQFAAQCDFGKQYKDSVKRITYVVDPDWQLKVHAQCPVLPQISLMNQAAEGAYALQQAAKAVAVNQSSSSAPPAEEIEAAEEALAGFPMNEDESEQEDLDVDDADPDASQADEDPFGLSTGASKTGRFDVKSTGAGVWQINEKFIDQVSKQDLILFELGRKLSLTIDAKKKGAFAPVQNIDKDKDTTNIKSVSEITKVESSQHGLPEKLFDAKLNKKTLTKVQYLKREEKKQCLYTLIDGSGSMQDSLGTKSTLGLHSKGQLAVVLSNAFYRRVKLDKGIGFMRLFGGAPGPLHQARTPEEFDLLMNFISLCNFGGGTDTKAALYQAIDDITAASDEIAKSELLLISDAEDDLDEITLKARLGKIELSFLDVCGSRSHRYGNAADVLKKVAKKYYKANEGALSIDKLVELI